MRKTPQVCAGKKTLPSFASKLRKKRLVEILVLAGGAGLKCSGLEAAARQGLGEMGNQSSQLSIHRLPWCAYEEGTVFQNMRLNILKFSREPSSRFLAGFLREKISN